MLIVAGTSVVLHYENIRRVVGKVCGAPEQPRTICVVLETASETVTARLAAREEAGSELDDCLRSSERWRGLLGRFVDEVRVRDGKGGGVELVELSMDGGREVLRENVVRLCDLISGEGSEDRNG